MIFLSSYDLALIYYENDLSLGRFCYNLLLIYSFYFVSSSGFGLSLVSSEGVMESLAMKVIRSIAIKYLNNILIIESMDW